MYLGIIETAGYGFRKYFTKEELARIEQLRKEMRMRLYER